MLMYINLYMHVHIYIYMDWIGLDLIRLLTVD